MTQSEIAQEILELLDEDSYGLWEIGWRLHEALGIDPSQEPSEVAEVIDSLVRERGLNLYVLDEPGGSMRPISALDGAVDLRDQASWEAPKPGERQIWLA